jgi:hypothetical protein
MIRRPDAGFIALLLALSLLIWAPRLRGPIDLRYDAGVYYILGTSLGQGKGYRLLNEPGNPQAIQYPPLLPALVAIYQKALGTDDPLVAGPWLRHTYFVIFIMYAIATYILARAYLRPGYSFLVTLITILYVDSIFLSDLLFAELPFALVAVLFILSSRRHERDILSIPTSLLGVTAFLLRSAGIALLAAWVAESLLDRRWKQAAARVCVALIPLVAWQSYIGRVKSSAEYVHPAYAYQRASYQYYNIGYLENILLVDPFVPELGRLTPLGLADRVARNLSLIPANLGRVVIGGVLIREWMANLEGHRGIFPRLVEWAFVPIPLAAGFLVLGGLSLFALKRDWLIPTYIAASLALICLTPWPGQFKRYVTPLLPLIALGLIRMLAALSEATLRRRPGVWRLAGPAFFVLVVSLTLGREVLSAVRTYCFYRSPVQRGASPGEAKGYRLFFYEGAWADLDAALAWLKANGRPGGVVASQASHWAYLATGMKSVLPPMEVDPATAQRLLDSVPVDYLVVDQLSFLDVSRRYAEPVVHAYPGRWTLLYTVPGTQTRIYYREGRGGDEGRSEDHPSRSAGVRPG